MISIKKSIKGIDQHLTADAFSTRFIMSNEQSNMIMQKQQQFNSAKNRFYIQGKFPGFSRDLLESFCLCWVGKLV